MSAASAALLEARLGGATALAAAAAAALGVFAVCFRLCPLRDLLLDRYARFPRARHARCLWVGGERKARREGAAEPPFHIKLLALGPDLMPQP